MINSEMKTVEVYIIAKEFGRVSVSVPVTATEEEIKNAAIQAESDGKALFFKRDVRCITCNQSSVQ